jgi:hypothetical protein
MSKNITRFYTPEEAEHLPVSFDLTKHTAVIIRRSTREHQEPSLALQEQLVTYAQKVRGENDDTNIRCYTHDGTPASQEQTSNLLDDITNGCIGSIIVERPDRLLRSEHAPMTNLLQKQQIIVIVPGKRVYDFNKEEDLKAFQESMQEAHTYIATHIKYMKASRKQKRQKR